MLARTTSREISEWMAYDRLAPLDVAWRVEQMLGEVLAMLHNVNRDPKKTDPARGKDYTPDWGRKYRDALDAETSAAQSAELWQRLEFAVAACPSAPEGGR